MSRRKKKKSRRASEEVRRRPAGPRTSPPPVEKKHDVGPKWLVLIFLVALGYRGICFISASGHPLLRYPIVDAGYHHAWAERIVAGDWLGHGQDDVFKPPLYPYFVAAHYAVFGPHAAPVQWSQFLLGALACVFVAMLGARLLGPGAGRIAGLASALYAPFVFFEMQLLTPSLTLFLNLGAMLLLIPAGKRPGYVRLAAAGLLLGLSAGVRPDVILPGFLVVLFLLLADFWRRWVQMAAAALCLVVAASMVLVPITVRNYHLTGQFIPVAANGGINFYVGNSAQADGISAVPVGLRWETLVGRVPQEILERPADASRWWARHAREEMKAAPGPTLARFAKKAMAIFNRREFRNNICYHYMQTICPPLQVSPFQYAAVLPLGVCGMILLWRGHGEGERRALVVCGLWIAGYWVVGVAFFVTARFRLPAVPLLILAASWAVVQIAAAVRQENAKMLAVQGAIVLAAGIACWPMWFGSPQQGWVRDHVNLGNSLKTSGDSAGAVRAYREAMTFAPDDPDANYLLGVMLLANEPAAALAHFEAARKSVPDAPDLLLALAQAQQAVGSVDAARETLHQLVDLQGRMNLWPSRAAWAKAHILLAELEPDQAAGHWSRAWSIDRRTAAEARFLRREELPRVLEAFRAEASEKPWDWYSQANLGLALLETGQAAESVTPLRKATRLAPEREAVRFQLARALLSAGQRDEALRILERLLGELPECPLRRQVRALREQAGLDTPIGGTIR